MISSLGAAKIGTAVFLLSIAILPNQVQLTRLDAPYVVYQIQLLGRIMYFCPEQPNKDVDCGRWARETAYGSTAFVQPTGVGKFVSVETVATH